MTSTEKRNQLLAKWTDLLHTEMCQSSHDFTPEDFDTMRDYLSDMVGDFDGIEDDKPCDDDGFDCDDDRDIERMRGVV